MLRADDRIGSQYFNVDPAKVIAVVEIDKPDRNLPFAAPPASSSTSLGSPPLSIDSVIHLKRPRSVEMDWSVVL